MKRSILMLVIFFMLSACATPATVTPSPVEAGQAEIATDTAMPAAEELPAENTPVPSATLQPTSAPTPIPPPARWYWGVQYESGLVVAANQFGEKREIGALPVSEWQNFTGQPLDGNRAILLGARESGILVYLLTLDGMQEIKLPPELVYDPLLSGSGLEIPAYYGNFAVISYVNQASYATPTSAHAERGPLLLVDLATLAVKVIDTEVNRDIFSGAFADNRFWAHRSDDGRYLRYINGDSDGMTLRELDLSNGEVRTVYTTTRHDTGRILRTLNGDMWRFVRDDLILDISGDQSDFKVDESSLVRMLKDGKLLVGPDACDDDCTVRVVSAFGGGADLEFKVPWAGNMVVNPLLYMLTPEQDLIFTGIRSSFLPTPPDIMAEYPAMNENDMPVFKLKADGSARLMGLYDPGFGYEVIPISTDGRYMLLGSTDHASYFIFDVFEDLPVAQMPVQPGLDYFWAAATYLENGAVVHFTASTPDKTYREFFMAYSAISGKSYTWESETIAGCFDILEDDSLVCETYVTDNASSRLVLFNPETQEITALSDDFMSLQAVR